ncbi:MAG: hypothetical protein Q7R70_06515 [Candidatus Diapherotrites archaeon]|nr:hypothetical protein [Candidatus Diapherotrites archaeon]
MPPKPRKMGRLKKFAITAAVAGTLVGGGVGAYHAGTSQHSPAIVRKVAAPYVRTVNAAGREIKVAGHAIAHNPVTRTGKSIVIGAAKLGGKVGDNAANRPIRTAAGALAAGWALSRIASGQKRQGKYHGKIVAGATALGAIGGAASPLTGIALGISAAAWKAMSPKAREKLVTASGRAAAEAARRAAEAARNRRRNPPRQP